MNLQHQENVPPKEHPIDAKIRRIKDCLLFFIVLMMILGVFGYCVSILFDVRSLDQARNQASLVITAILCALIGYLVGKTSK